MLKSLKVYNALLALKPAKARRFSKFVESPYFNRDPTLPALLDLLTSAQKNQSTSVMTKEEAWHRLKGKTPFNNARFRKYCSDLLQLFSLFLTVEQLEQQPATRKLLEVEQLRQLGLHNILETRLASTKADIECDPRRNGVHFLRKFQLASAELARISTQRNTEVLDLLHQCSDNLDQMYFIEKLKIHNSLLGRTFYKVNEEPTRMINSVLDIATSDPKFNLGVVSTYARLHKLYQSESEESLVDKLIQSLQEQRDMLSDSELKECYYSIFNFQVRKANSGDHQALLQIVELFKAMTATGGTGSDNELNPWIFKNVVLAGLRTQQFDWVLHTLQVSEPQLPEDYKQNALAFNYAQVHFYRRDFGRVLEYLQQVEYQDPAYALNSRNLLVAVYYEIGQIEPLYSTVNSFRTYLKRQTQLSDRIRTGYRDLLNVTLKLAKAQPQDAKALAQIRTFLEETPTTISRQWLQAKLEELQAGKRAW